MLFAPYLAGLAVVGILYGALVAMVPTGPQETSRVLERQPPRLVVLGLPR